MVTKLKSKNGFTLIELLVVISIIALLLSILMPGLSKAKRSAQVVVCAANSHSISAAAFAFSSSYGKLPVAYHLSGTQYVDSSTCYPFWIQGDEKYAINGEWKKYGTTMQTWKDMGASEKVWLCPSQKWLGYATWWGDHTKIVSIEHQYCGIMYRVPMAYIAGVNYEKNSFNDKNPTNKPNVKFLTNIDDKTPASKIMGGDVVMYNPPTPGVGWYRSSVDEYYINHTVKWGMPYAQNILYGDGSVRNIGANVWTKNPIISQNKMYRRTYTFTGDYLCYMFFGGTDWYNSSK